MWDAAFAPARHEGGCLAVTAVTPPPWLRRDGRDRRGHGRGHGHRDPRAGPAAIRLSLDLAWHRWELPARTSLRAVDGACASRPSAGLVLAWCWLDDGGHATSQGY